MPGEYCFSLLKYLEQIRHLLVYVSLQITKRPSRCSLSLLRLWRRSRLENNSKANSLLLCLCLKIWDLFHISQNGLGYEYMLSDFSPSDKK